MSTSNAPLYIDALITQITTSTNAAGLNHTFKAGIQKETREALFSSFLSSGQDPLSVLDVRVNTLGVLYILSARLNANYQTTTPPPWNIVLSFCRHFIPEHARLAAERVTKLAKGIQRMAQYYNNPSVAISPLRDLVMRYPHDSSYLTTIHPIFILSCVATRNFPPALAVLNRPITEISLLLSPDLTYNDNLTYHYAGGIALAAMKKWAEAEEYFEIAVTAPGTYPAALQMEALKKLKLVQLISRGTVTSLPKYTHAFLIRAFKNTVYQAFIGAYPHNTELLKEICEKERSSFMQDKNLGLINQAFARAPRWALKKLTATYVTLHLSDIGKAVGIEKEDDVRALLLSMIETSDVSATISHTGSVTFSDPPPTFTKESVDRALQGVQHQAQLLNYLEMELGRGKEYLTKAVKKEGSGGGVGGGMGLGGLGGMGMEGSWNAMEEEAYANMGANWEDGPYS